jgi:hypothetical protein
LFISVNRPRLLLPYLFGEGFQVFRNCKPELAVNNFKLSLAVCFEREESQICWGLSILRSDSTIFTTGVKALVVALNHSIMLLLLRLMLEERKVFILCIFLEFLNSYQFYFEISLIDSLRSSFGVQQLQFFIAVISFCEVLLDILLVHLPFIAVRHPVDLFL